MARPKFAKNPSTAEAFESLRADYNAQKSTRHRRKRTGVNAMGSGADYHYRSEAKFLHMLEEARDMDRNDVIVGQTVDRAVANTIQDGIKLDTNTGDKKLDDMLSDLWNDWSTDPDKSDVSGELSFCDMESLVLRQAIVDGDIVALPLKEGSLQLVEAHRIRTPKNTRKNVIAGVLLGKRRKRLEYWFTKDDIDPNRSLHKVGDTRHVRTRDGEGFRQVFHVYNPKRATQTRGVTAFAPIFDTSGIFEDINFAKLVQQQIVSCFAIFKERELNFDGSGGQQQGSQETETLADGTVRTIEGVAPGMQIEGEPGEKLQGFSPNVPNAEFFNHAKLTIQLIGVNLGMPLALVLLDASETNFSGWRGAIDQARLGFKANQKWLVGRFHKQVYLWKVRQWLDENPILQAMAERDGVNVFGHRWNLPKWPYIEPLKDASADLLRIRNVLTSPRRLHQERGAEWSDIYTETVEDNGGAIEAAIIKAAEINESYPDNPTPIHWRELLSLPTAEGVQVNITADASDSEAETKPKNNGDKRNGENSRFAINNN